MAIYYYDGTQKNPPNYEGIRVNVMVAGKVKQKWFSFKTKITSPEEQIKVRAEAEALHQTWIMEKNLNKKRPEKFKNELPIFSTGVMGIKMKFRKQVARRANGEKQINYTPVFDVSGQKNGKRFHQQFNLKTQGYDEAWLLACHCLSEKHSISFDDIYAKKPPIEKILMVLDWQRKRGDNIATERLPNELLERFKNDQDEATQQIYQNILTDEEKAKTIFTQTNNQPASHSAEVRLT